MTTNIISKAGKDLYDDLYAGRLAEDPCREPHEKEWGFHAEGDSSRASFHSFKKVQYAKLLALPQAEVEWLHVVDESKNESTATLPEFLQNPNLTAIGAQGTIPVGSITIGVGRASDSHAEVVK